MQTFRSGTAAVLRHNTLAACLAAALTATSASVLAASQAALGDQRATLPPLLGASAAAPAHPPAHAADNRSLLDAARAPQPSGANRTPRRARPATPVRPAALVAVTNCDDDGPGSLREAALNAADGDVLDLHLLTCSTISLSSGSITTGASDLTLLGPGREALTIDGNYNGYVLDGYGSMTVVDLTITHGSSTTGFGGCVSVFGDLTLTRSTVTGCKAGDGTNNASYGAGVDVRGNLYMTSSTISHSDASAMAGAYGGAAYVKGSAQLDHSTISSNRAHGGTTKARGGGLFVKHAAYLIDSRLLNNAVSSTDGTAYGGAVAASAAGGSGVAAIGSTISGNTAHSDTQWSYGGGLNAGDGDGIGWITGGVALYHSTLSDNTASADCDDCFIQGGGAHATGLIQVHRSTVSGNLVESLATSYGTARGGGLSTLQYGGDGVIALYDSTLSGNAALGGEQGVGNGGGLAAIRGNQFGGANVTIAFNRASTFGGGVVGGNVSGAAPIFLNSILAMNDAPVGGDIASVTGAWTMAGTNNLVMVAAPEVTLPADTLSADPKLLPLANNGGVTATHALAACSPAIDVGVAAFGDAFDQRNDPYAREYGGGVDIGAFELQPDDERIFADGFEASPCP